MKLKKPIAKLKKGEMNLSGKCKSMSLENVKKEFEHGKNKKNNRLSKPKGGK